MITVVGIGTGSVDTLTLGAIDSIKNADKVILQTAKVPVAEYISGITDFITLDDIYDECEDFDEFTSRAVEMIRSHQTENTVFCVIGSINANPVAVQVLDKSVPGVTQAGFAADALKTASSAFYVTASDFENTRIHTQYTLIITEVDTPYKAADISAKLLDYYPFDHEVFAIAKVGINAVPLNELSRLSCFDYSCSLVIPPVELTKREGFEFSDLMELMAILRGENGCPWDREQTHESLRPFLIEEASEAVDAINSGDMWALADELGDVLLQVALNAQIATENEDFTDLDVMNCICKKMIHRHAHIFGDKVCKNADDVLKSWDSIKRADKGKILPSEDMKNITATLPALMRAQKIQRKARTAGFDWDSPADALLKLKEEVSELEEVLDGGNTAEEAGDVLFAAVNVIRLLGLDAETELKCACAKFIRRYEKMESLAGGDISGLSLEEQNKLWENAKNTEY